MLSITVFRCSDFDHWVDPGDVRRQYGIGPMDPMVLIVGRMVYQKGPDLLVSAIPYILNYYPNAKFVFVGDGEMRQKWNIRPATRGYLTRHVFWASKVPGR